MEDINIKSLLQGGIRKDPEDDRDFIFTTPHIPDHTVLGSADSIPLKIDHSNKMGSVKFQGALGCHDIRTEILTEKGWKLFKDLDKEEKVATVNPNTHEIEYQEPINYLEYDYEGDMYYFHHKSGLDAMVTPNHKMYVKKWDNKNMTLKEEFEFIEAQNMGWYSGLLTKIDWDGISPKTMKMPDVEIGQRNGSKKQSIRIGKEIDTTNFITFLGLYLAEGCCYRPEGSGSYRIEIAASDNNDRKNEVIEIIDDLPYKYTIYHDRITIWNKSLYTFLKPFGNVYTKSVPRFVMDLNKKDIAAFMYGYYLGDGSFHDNGARTGYSVSEHLIDDLQELSLKIGVYSRKKSRSPRIAYIKGRKIFGKESYELHERQIDTKLSIDRNKYSSKVPYNNKVYCVEVPNHILITRRGGCILISGNSCVAFAACALKEWQETIEHEKEVLAGKKDHREGKEYNLSEQWIYWNCKKIDPWPNSEGTNLRSAMRVLNKIGVPTEQAWGYTDDKVNIGEPESWAYMIARWNLIGSYWRISGLDQIKKALIESPIIIGMACFREMYGNLEHGLIPYPANPGEVMSHHAVCVVGYDEEKKLLKFKNSWSKFWGDVGYGYIPYDYVRDFVWDAWIARDISVTHEMLEGTRLLVGADVPTVIEIAETPLIQKDTEENFSFVGFKYPSLLDTFSIIKDIFGVPEIEIFRASKKVGVKLEDSSSINLFCKKYFAEFRKESVKKYGFEVDVIKVDDEYPIIGICLCEKEISDKFDENQIKIEDVMKKVVGMRDILALGKDIIIYNGVRKY